jgi:hypothetical protein
MFGSKIKLDADLLKRCKAHAKAAGYSSVEEFIHHAVEGALNKTSSASSDGEKKVLERLKGLGYIE